MHYKSSFNALIMYCNAPYNALYNCTNNCNSTVNTYQFIVTLFNYNYLQDVMYFNVHYKSFYCIIPFNNPLKYTT